MNQQESKETNEEVKKGARRQAAAEPAAGREPAEKNGSQKTDPKPAENGEQAEKKEQAENNPAEELEGKRKSLQEELNQQKDLLLRTAAEYDNYRKRTEREKLALYADATRAAVTEFLPVADNLERALAQKDCTAEDLRKGVEMVQTQMDAALKKLGVTAMGKVGEPFNPDFHNAVSHVEDESAGENTVSQVFQKGYKIEDKVVRHAMVQVAN